MRRFMLLGLMTFWLLANQTAVRAGTRFTAPVEDPTREYWNQAHKLSKEQLLLLDRVEQAITGSTSDRFKALRGQVFLHISAVDRFLQTNYPDPNLFCSPPREMGSIAGTDAVSLEQAKAYCGLFFSTRELSRLRVQLALRSETSDIGKIGNNTTNNTTTVTLASQLASPNPLGIGKVTRGPLAPTVSTIAMKEDLRSILQSSRQRLAQMQPIFPLALRLAIPVHAPSEATRKPKDLAPDEMKPSTKLEAMQNQQRRFLFGEVYNFVQPLANSIPAELDRTYLEGSLQFNLPERITFEQKKDFTEPRSQDWFNLSSHTLLFAVRPVSRRADDHYSVLWQMIQQLADPNVLDWKSDFQEGK